MTLAIKVATCLQPVQQKTVKIEILDLTNSVIGEISGKCIDGSVNIDSQSSIRRTCDLMFILDSTTLISETSLLWINKRFRLYIGILNNSTGVFQWYLQGTYIINDPTTDIDITSRTVSIKGLDKMAMHSGDLSGQLSFKTIISSGINIGTAIQSTLDDLTSETNYLIDEITYTTPYKIEKDAGSTVYDVLKELSDLYMTYKIFYDVNGIFRLSKIKDSINDSLVFDFSIYNIIKTISKNDLYSNVRNYYKIIGRMNSNGVQYSSEVTVTDILYPDCLFTTDKLGETRKYVESKENLYTQEQVDDYRDYMIYKHLTLSESISFTCLPLLFLDVDNLVYIDFTEYGIIGTYMVDSIDLSMKHDGLMNISAHKIY